MSNLIFYLYINFTKEKTRFQSTAGERSLVEVKKKEAYSLMKYIKTIKYSEY